MAFDAAEKALILFYLGYSAFEDDGPAMRAINSMDSREATIRPIIEPILLRLEEIDLKIKDTEAIAMAVRDGSIELRVHYTMAHLCNLGKQQVARLSRWIKVRPCPQGDVFSTRLPDAGFYSGDPSERRGVDSTTGAPTQGGDDGGRW